MPDSRRDWGTHHTRKAKPGGCECRASQPRGAWGATEPPAGRPGYAAPTSSPPLADTSTPKPPEPSASGEPSLGPGAAQRVWSWVARCVSGGPWPRWWSRCHHCSSGLTGRRWGKAQPAGLRIPGWVIGQAVGAGPEEVSGHLQRSSSRRTEPDPTQVARPQGEGPSPPQVCMTWTPRVPASPPCGYSVLHAGRGRGVHVF